MTTVTTRRHELDWLRVIAFMVLIYFHAAIFFVPFGLPTIQNPENSEALAIFVKISSQFRLALLFFISGVGVYFAKRKLSDPEFIRERSRRLLIPFFFGMVFVVPPMVYTEKLFLGMFDGSLLEFYPRIFSDGVYPEGNLSWHHFWFIAYLYIFCVLAILPFRWIDRVSGDTTFGRFSGLGIYRVIPILLVPEILLRWAFPGFRDLISDWASFTLWFIVFLAGYVIATRIQLIDDVIRHRNLSLALAIGATLAIFGIFGDTRPGFTEDLAGLFQYVLWCALRMTMVWCAILSCLGFAGRYLQFSNRILQYLNEAVYPLFILHLTALVVFGYFIVALDWSLWLKYWVLTTATIVFVLAFYHVAIRPFDTMRLVFGVKPKEGVTQAALSAST